MIIYRGTNIALDLGFQPDGKEKAGLTSHSIEFSFELSEYVKLEKGDMIEFNSKKFYLPKNFIPVKNKNTDGFKYNLQFFDLKERFKDFILKYSLQGVDETSFKLTASGDKFLDIVIYTLGKQGITLTKGQFPSEIKEINFENIDVFAGLNLIAETYKLEWWTDGTTLNLGKLEHGNPVLLRYDHELDDISFSQSSEKLITRLYAFGGTRNIPYNYRTETGAVDNIAERRLRMPVDYIDLFENLPENQIIEGVEIFEDIYPKQNNKIVSVETVLYKGNGVDTQDTTAYIIKGDNTFEITEKDIEAGKPLMIAFTSGHLNGREFELIIKGGNKYEIKHTQDGNIVIPNSTLKPQAGDSFFFFNFKADAVLPTIIPEAENELLAQAKAFLNNIGSEYVYDVKTRSILCENMGIDLELGQVVTIQSEELGSITSRVQSYEKDLYNKYEATYQIGDYSKYSRLREIEGRIKPPQKFDPETFQRTITSVFRDGIVTETELRAVESQLTSLQTEKAQLNAQYLVLKNSSFLIDKTALETSWNTYSSSYNDLYTSIKNAVSDGEISESEKTDIDNKIGSYISSISALNTELENAQEAIINERSEQTLDSAQQKIDESRKQIEDEIKNQGSVNLVRNSGFTGDYLSVPLESQTSIEAITEFSSNKLVHWTNSGCNVIKLEQSKSGFACEFGTLSQTLELELGKKYILTCFVKGILEFNGTQIANNADYAKVEHIFIPETKTITLSGVGTLYDLQVIRGTVGDDWKPNPNDDHKVMERMLAYNYITQAIKSGSASVIGGLILANMIQVGNYQDGLLQKVTGIVSGIYNDESDPFLIGGGTLEDGIRRIQNPFADKVDENGNPLANFAVTHGGDLYANNAYIRGIIHALDGVFSGTVFAKDGEFTGKVNAGSGKIGNFEIIDGKLVGNNQIGDRIEIYPKGNEIKIYNRLGGEVLAIYTERETLEEGRTPTFLTKSFIRFTQYLNREKTGTITIGDGNIEFKRYNGDLETVGLYIWEGGISVGMGNDNRFNIRRGFTADGIEFPDVRWDGYIPTDRDVAAGGFFMDSNGFLKVKK